uniref:Uncharacterized protein n=1 Tax=Anguilla anguilla TaxID=7936 RepID=A0A0E9XQK1_ANGAN
MTNSTCLSFSGAAIHVGKCHFCSTNGKMNDYKPQLKNN